MQLPRLGHHRIDHALNCLRDEYRALPGLSLTTPQAGRLLGLEPAVAAALLDALVDARFLKRRPDGRYVRSAIAVGA